MSSSAATWVLLRGLTREAGHWGTFPNQLRAQLQPNARVLAVDLPGNGQLHRARSPADIGTTMEQLRAHLRTLGARPPFHLLSMSLGAMVAVEWATQHPAELAGCVLVNTSLRPFSPWYRRLRPRNYGTLVTLALSGQAAREREEAVLRITTRHPPQPIDAVLDAWTALRMTRPVSRANALRQLIAAARYRAPQRPPVVPLAVALGAADGLVDPRCSRRLAQQWQLPLAEHPTAGHDLPLDDGPWLAAQVAAWAARWG